MKGLGLGLSIAQANAHLLGGNIAIESQLNHGSTFTLNIPNTLLETGITPQKDHKKQRA